MNALPDDFPITYLIMDQSARQNIYKATVLQKSVPIYEVAVERAARIGGVVIKVVDAGEMYLRPQLM